jgi:hypothetical protein
MAEKMVRKQLYIGPEQDRKLKRLASARHCTEAEVMRDAIDGLPEAQPDSPLIASLRRQGLIAPPPTLPPEIADLSREELEAKLYELQKKNKNRFSLTELVLRERAESPY